MPDEVYGEPPSPEAIAALVAVLGMAIDRYVKNRARRTIVENAKADPAKPKCRWVVEPDACDFCKKRGGFIYDPKETPTNAHYGCNCHPDAVYGKTETAEERHRRRIDEAVVVHDAFYTMTPNEVRLQRERYDSELRAKWAEYKAMKKQDGVSPKIAYDSTVGSYFASLSLSGRMSVDSFVELTNNKGHEAQLAKWFADAGHTVRLRISPSSYDTNDALIDGIAWEFKRITSGSVAKLNRRVTEKLPRQGPRFVIDLSESPITDTDAESAVAKLLDDENIIEILLVQNGRVKHFKK